MHLNIQKPCHLHSSIYIYVILGNGEFIEHAVFAGNMYGTSKAAVETVKSKGEVFATKNVSNHEILI